MMGYASVAEKGYHGLNEASLKEFLREYVDKKLRNYTPLSPPEFIELKNGWVIRRGYIHASKPPISIGFHVWLENSGPRAEIVWPILSGILMSEPAPKIRGRRQRERQWADSLKKDMPLLERLKLKGARWILVRPEKAPRGLATLGNWFKLEPEQRMEDEYHVSLDCSWQRLQEINEVGYPGSMKLIGKAHRIPIPD